MKGRKKKREKSSRVAQWVKDPALSLQWLGSLAHWSLAWELLHAAGTAKKTTTTTRKTKVRDFNTYPQQWKVHLDFGFPVSRQKIKNNKQEKVIFNYTIDQMDKTDTNAVFHLTAAEYTFFSSAHETFSRTDGATKN